MYLAQSHMQQTPSVLPRSLSELSGLSSKLFPGIALSCLTQGCVPSLGHLPSSGWRMLIYKSPALPLQIRIMLQGHLSSRAPVGYFSSRHRHESPKVRDGTRGNIFD